MQMSAHNILVETCMGLDAKTSSCNSHLKLLLSVDVSE